MARGLAARLDAVEKRLRPSVLHGISSVILTVPRSEVASLGAPCPEHASFSVRRTGLISTHFLADEGYDR